MTNQLAILALLGTMFLAGALSTGPMAPAKRIDVEVSKERTLSQDADILP